MNTITAAATTSTMGTSATEQGQTVHKSEVVDKLGARQTNRQKLKESDKQINTQQDERRAN